jgi:hypothetical protein
MFACFLSGFKTSVLEQFTIHIDVPGSEKIVTPPGRATRVVEMRGASRQPHHHALVWGRPGIAWERTANPPVEIANPEL